MKERPILMGDEMVRAILSGAKTQTRRPVKPQPAYQGINSFCFEKHPFAPSGMRGTPAEGLKLGPESDVWLAEDWCKNIVGVLGDCPHGAPGDRLWVRETWQAWCESGNNVTVAYRAHCENDEFDFFWDDKKAGTLCVERRVISKWRPSIHMPRWASRITLELTDVRVERLQDISEADAKAEGVTCEPPGTDSDNGFDYPAETPAQAFARVWGELYGFNSWNRNEWVWALTTRRVEAQSAAVAP